MSDELDRRRILVRRALRDAPGLREPSMVRLLESIPDLMDEARRRRSRSPQDFAAALSLRARRALPKLAAATAVVLVIACSALIFERQESTTSTQSESFDSLILTDSEDTGSSDELYEAVVGEVPNG